jgi:hypothetical protein
MPRAQLRARKRRPLMTMGFEPPKCEILGAKAT